MGHCVRFSSHFIIVSWRFTHFFSNLEYFWNFCCYFCRHRVYFFVCRFHSVSIISSRNELLMPNFCQWQMKWWQKHAQNPRKMKMGKKWGKKRIWSHVGWCVCSSFSFNWNNYFHSTKEILNKSICYYQRHFLLYI